MLNGPFKDNRVIGSNCTQDLLRCKNIAEITSLCIPYIVLVANGESTDVVYVSTTFYGLDKRRAQVGLKSRDKSTDKYAI